MSWYNPASWDWGAAKDWMFGGGATKGMPTDPKTGDFQRGYLQDDFLKRQAPQMNVAQSNQARDQQQGLARMLFATAQGSTPGAGEMAVNRQVGQAQAAQTAQAQMARGANAALAARTAARNQADIGVQGAGMAQQAQLQDATNAQANLGSLLGTMRGQDVNVAGANLNANMGQQQLQLGALAQMLGVDEAALRAAAAKAGVASQDRGAFGGLLQTAGQIGAAYAVGGK